MPREIFARMILLDVFHQKRCRDQIVGRDVEEALNLPGMEVEGEHAVGARRGDHIGDQLGGNRGART